MLPYLYVAVALISTSLNVSTKMNIVANNQCYYEVYRACYIPDHCLYYDKYYDFSPIIGDYNIKLHLYYDIISDTYMTSKLNNIYKNILMTDTHPFVKYFKKLEVASSSIQLYNKSYTYTKDLTELKDFDVSELYTLLELLMLLV